MAIKQISVFLENKPGMLKNMCQILADHKIDMRALSLAETKDFGIARMIVDDIFSTTNVLREAGFVNRLTPVIAVCIPDETGGLNKVLDVLMSIGTNLEYMYSSLGKEADHAYMIFRIDQNEKAAEAALRNAGIRVLTQEEVSEL
ncbi:MAG: acetolactate synthase [Eubacterium sp.]|nr:acetolactate synthase [Eubacterium sp.]